MITIESSPSGMMGDVNASRGAPSGPRRTMLVLNGQGVIQPEPAIIRDGVTSEPTVRYQDPDDRSRSPLSRADFRAASGGGGNGIRVSLTPRRGLGRPGRDPPSGGPGMPPSQPLGPPPGMHCAVLNTRKCVICLGSGEVLAHAVISPTGRPRSGPAFTTRSRRVRDIPGAILMRCQTCWGTGQLSDSPLTSA